MLPSDDAHRPAFADRRQELLVLLALGEPVDEWFDAHQMNCPSCQHDLASYRETVTLARLGEGDGQRSVTGPPPSVWTGIARTLGFDEQAAPDRLAATTSPGAARPPDAAPREQHRDLSSRLTQRVKIGLAVAATVLAIGAGVGIGAAVVGSSTSTPSRPQILSQAALIHQPGGPASVSGAAKVHTSTLGLAISVDTAGLPLRHGYYQVWLYDPAGKHMLPVGALNDDGHGTFTIPAGVDLRTYDVVDISAQDYDGNYEHKQSVLQGPLTQ